MLNPSPLHLRVLGVETLLDDGDRGTGADGGVRPGATTRASQSSEAVSGSAAAARGGATTAANSPATKHPCHQRPVPRPRPAPIHSTRLLPSGAKLRCNDRELAPP